MRRWGWRRIGASFRIVTKSGRLAHLCPPRIMHRGVIMGKWRLLAVLFVALFPAISWAQCNTGLINSCPAAVTPQAGDLAWVWQNNQSPHTRAATFGQVLAGALSQQLPVKVNAMPS